MIYLNFMIVMLTKMSFIIGIMTESQPLLVASLLSLLVTKCIIAGIIYLHWSSPGISYKFLH